MTDWQPIETAPKDGVTILGYGECAGEIGGPQKDSTMCPIMWNGGRTDWLGYTWEVVEGDAYVVWMKPTHWMPLPDPPK